MRRIRECHDGLIDGELTHRIIGAFYHVYNRLGYGFLESVYSRAMALELTKRGLHVATEVACEVHFDGEIVGVFRADLMVESRLVLELKASQVLHMADRMQLLNYLRATDLEIGLLLHFGPKPAFKRLIATNTDLRGSNRQSSQLSAPSASAHARRAPLTAAPPPAPGPSPVPPPAAYPTP